METTDSKKRGNAYAELVIAKAAIEQAMEFLTRIGESEAAQQMDRIQSWADDGGAVLPGSSEDYAPAMRQGDGDPGHDPSAAHTSERAARKRLEELEASAAASRRVADDFRQGLDKRSSNILREEEEKRQAIIDGPNTGTV